MDKNDFNNYYGNPPFNRQNDFNNKFEEFNPVAQYEQGYIYYRYLTQQLEYKIKCKEFEKLCSNERDVRNERRIG